MRLALDHIAVAARSLDEGVAHVRGALGIEMPPGGAHPLMGTHNRLMALGPELFLEVISVDPAATPNRPRWFGLDHFDAAPRLATWIVSTDDIAAALPLLPASLGPATTITRGDLEWQLSVPGDGALPMEGAFPSVIDWPRGTPAGAMTDLGCRLHRLHVTHPQADLIRAALAGHLTDPRVTLHSGEACTLMAEIDTPSGRRVLR